MLGHVGWVRLTKMPEFCASSQCGHRDIWAIRVARLFLRVHILGCSKGKPTGQSMLEVPLLPAVMSHSEPQRYWRAVYAPREGKVGLLHRGTSKLGGCPLVALFSPRTSTPKEHISRYLQVTIIPFQHHPPQKKRKEGAIAQKWPKW